MSVMRAGLAPLLLSCRARRRASAKPRRSRRRRPRRHPPAPPRQPHAGLTILVVDVQSLLQNSKSAKMVRQQIEQKRAEYAKEISHQEEALRQERDALQRQQASLSAEALNQKGREFQQKVNELDKSVQGKRQALERSNAEALEKIQERDAENHHRHRQGPKSQSGVPAQRAGAVRPGLRRDGRGAAEARRADADTDRQLCRAASRPQRRGDPPRRPAATDKPAPKKKKQ